jgi:hypothetical protein
VRNVIAGLIVDRAAATRVTVDLEAGYSGYSDADFEHIAGVTGQSHAWNAPRGSLDRVVGDHMVVACPRRAGWTP